MVSKYPTRPPRWHESVIKSYPVSDLRRLIEAADKEEEARSVCGLCGLHLGDPCSCFDRNCE